MLETSESRVASGRTLVDRFDAQVRRRGDHPALVGPSVTMTFAEVGEQAERGASSIVARCGRGTEPVALLLEHDVALVVAILAVMKAGRPFTVLDPVAPPEVNADVHRDSGAAVVVHDEANADGARKLPGATTASWEELISGDLTVLAAPVSSDIAMLAYTSGSTGAAKAAAIPHEALIHLMDGATEVLGIDEHEQMPMLFPLSLAVAAYPAFLPLVNGATLHTFDMRSLGLAPFPGWLVDHGISLIYFSPTVARFLDGAASGDRYPHLRMVVLGGERVDDDAVDVVRRVFGEQVTVVNGYGTTETGVLCFHRIEPGTRYGARGVPVGAPIKGMELLIVDAAGAKVPDGEVGELVVCSSHLFAGYWHRPDLDASVLSVDAANGLPRYRTGDLGRWREGELELVGRSDTEVKVRGHRVVPGEIEQSLLALPEVIDAVVDARPDLMGTNQLVAWVAPADGVDEEQVRSALGSSVKRHLVPATFVLVDALPLLPNGKLDRRALPEPPTGRPTGLPAYVAPQGDVEEMVLDAWEQIFPMRPIGLHDPFDALGGRSLDAAQMLVVLESRHGVQVPMADLIEATTIAGVAERIRHDRRRQSSIGRRNAITVVTPETSARPTLYCLHDLHGTAYSLRHLAPLLGVDQPLAGFESPFLDGNRAPFTSLETLALRHVTDLQRHQPAGPYYLAGYSFGGVLAFEMARQLVAAGESVPFLGVFDVGPGYRGRHFHPRRPPQKPTLTVPMAPGEAGRLETLRWYGDLALHSPLDLVENVLIRTGADRLADRAREERDLRLRGAIHPARRLWYAWRTHWKLARSYSWDDRRYPGPLTLFWAEESASADATMGWGSVVERDLRIVRVPIKHETFLQKEGVEGIADALRAELDRTIAGATEGPA